MSRFACSVFLTLWCVSALAQASGPETTATSESSREAIIGRPAGSPLTGEALKRRTVEVAALLRCPVCQGLSIADSPASMAVNMKQEVNDLLAAGYSEEQVLLYFEKSYGEFVRLQPPLRGFNWLVWLAPVAALLIGAAIVMRFIRRPSQGSAVKIVAPEKDRIPAEDPYLSELRRLAYPERSGPSASADEIKGK